VYGSYGGRHVFVNGEDLGLSTVQGGNLQFGNSHKEPLGNNTSLAGGAQNTGSQSCSFIGAGSGNNISGSGNKSFIGAGVSNSIQTSANSANAIVAGTSNLIDDTITGAGNNFIGAGSTNKVVGGCSGIVSGYNNCITATKSFIGGGTGNMAISLCTTVVGGGYNCARNSYAFVGGGYSNDAAGYASFIGGGYNNTISNASCAFIGGGASNGVDAAKASVLGGYCNVVYSTGGCGAILGGCSQKVCHTYSSILNGYNLTTTTSNTAYATNLTVSCHLQVGGTTTLNTTTGRIDATNDVVAFATSDRRLKCNIKPIENALCKVIGVTGNTFDWKELLPEEIKTIHGNKGHDVGVIAQEIEAILPEAVTTRESGYKAVNYEKIVPLLIEAVKTLTLKVEVLESNQCKCKCK